MARHLSAKTVVPVGGVEPNGTTCAQRAAAQYSAGQNGARVNVGGDYNWMGFSNDHPTFIVQSEFRLQWRQPGRWDLSDNNRIACGEAGTPATVTLLVTSSQCNGFTPSTLFGNPALSSGTTPYMRFWQPRRDVFIGPKSCSSTLA